MPTDPNRPPQRGWRVGGDTAGEAKRAWRKEAATPAPAGRKWSLRSLFLPILLLFLGTVGLFIWVATRFIPPSPAYLVFLRADYAENLAVPPHLHGWQSADAFRHWAEGDKRPFLWWKQDLFGGPAAHVLRTRTLTEWADSVKDRKEDTIILYVSAHGAADRHGTYFLPDDFKPYGLGDKRGAGGVLRLADLLGKLPRDKNKLVILDATAAPPQWALDQLHNDFARRLNDELDKHHKDTPRLLILSASGPDERSWESDEWGRSVFGHFVLEGLAGAADGAAKSHTNGQVDADELAHYVQARVADWVRANRDETQTPVLWASTGVQPDRMALAVTGRPAPAPAATMPEQALRTLESEWKRCHEFQSAVPAPAAYAPHVWRLYVDTLLRCEQIIRAGDPTQKASTLLQQLGGLAEKIEEARRPRLGNVASLVQTALPMPSVLGQDPALPASQLEARLDEFWKADEKKWEQLERDLVRNLQASQTPLVRVRLAGLLLDRAEKRLGPAERARTRRLLELFQPDAPRRPTEAQTLLILDQELNKPEPPPADLALALRTCLTAERTALAAELAATSPGEADPNRPLLHPYSERVFRWTGPRLRSADDARRTGLDWLLGANEEHWQLARKELAAALTAYREIQQDVFVLREAFNLRDQVLAELPYLTRWLAGRRLTPDKKAYPEELRKLNQHVERVERLWQNVHLLSFRLQTATPDGTGVRTAPPPDKLDPEPRSLKDRAALVRDDFKEVKSAFHAEAGLPADGALPVVWHRLDGALSVPFFDPARRQDVLRARTRISATLLREFEGRPDEARQKAWTTERTSEPQEAAQRQGRCVLASLGRPWLAEQEKQGGPSYDTLRGTIFDPRRDWWNPLQDAGEHLGRLQRRLPQAIREIMDRVHDAEKWTAGRGADDYLAAIAPDLARAEGHCRLLDGPAALQLEHDPVSTQRRLLLHDLFLAQAERAWRDHWWCTRDEHRRQKEPYFAAAVKTYLDAARELVQDGPAKDDRRLRDLRLARVTAAEGRWRRTELTCLPKRPAPLAWTTEKTLPVEWELTAKDVPEGVVMVRLRPDASLRPASAGDDPALRRPHHAKGGTEKVEYLLRRAEALEAEGAANRGRPPVPAHAELEVVFRGQPLEDKTRIDVYREPDTVAYRTPPDPVAGIAVRADGTLHLGTLAIVLDCSGSMGPKKAGRYGQALAVLRDVLKEVPKGTTLSVWAFSHANAKAKDGIDPIQLPLTWDPEAHLDNLMKDLENLTPYGQSPIVDAMVKAKAHLTGKTGLRTLLVLTDGEDNIYQKELGEKQREDAIAQRIDREFRGGDESDRILVSMVLFQNNDDDIKKAQRQFKSVLENLPLPGNWYESGNTKRLAADLLRSMRPRLRLLRDGKPVSEMPEGFRVTYRDEAGLGWSKALEAEWQNRRGVVYEAWVQNVHQFLVLDPGDCMAILLKPDAGRGVRFERGLFADLYGRKPVQQDRGDWRLAVHQNKHVRGGSGDALELLLSVENFKDVAPVPPGKGLLRQPPRGFLWMEMTANGKPQPGLRWGNAWYHPGPTWQVGHGRWPLAPDSRLVAPELSAWWLADPRAPAHRTLAHRDPQRRFEDHFRNLETEAAGVKVWIESVEVDKYPVEGQPQGVECLVVRLRHEPKDRPVWVQLSDLEARGEEHHFYAQPGKVTAYFWPVTRERAQQGFTLGLVSVAEFKNAAFHVDAKDLKLGTPDLADGPRPVKLGR